jgi:hypothetical protein
MLADTQNKREFAADMDETAPPREEASKVTISRVEVPKPQRLAQTHLSQVP